MLRARSREMGSIATVPFKVPVALLGYSDAIGLGRSYVWHDSASGVITSVAAGFEKYDTPTYRRATSERSVTMKYWSRDSVSFEEDILLPERMWFIIFLSGSRSTNSYISQTQ